MTLRLKRTDLYRFASTDQLPDSLTNGAQLLVPTRHTELPPKAVGSGLADVLTKLSVPTPLSSLDAGVMPALLPLVFDGVLGLDDGRDAAETGPGALQRLARQPAHHPRTEIARISRDAVRCAASLPAASAVDEITAFLYRFNTLPLTQDRIDTYQGWRPPPVVGWQPLRPESSDSSGWWMHWPLRPHLGTTHKLYIGLHPDDLISNFSCLASTLRACGCPPFKVGRGADGVSRADKLVVYFPTSEDCVQAAERLSSALGHLRVQPVPFSLQLDEDGLVSAGMDPEPMGEADMFTTSWRLEVCHDLATALVVTRTLGPGAMTATDAAFHRLRIMGIDPDTWSPAEWRQVPSGNTICQPETIERPNHDLPH